jgi:hypothetical protein
MTVSLAASRRNVSPGPQAVEQTFSNASGLHRSVSTVGTIDEDNPFFQELGTNGRTCITCHQPAQAWTITPAELEARFTRTSGLDPVFRANDGATCEGADVSTIEKRRQAFSLLLTKGLIRVGLDVPKGAEFEIAGVDDPYACGTPLTSASMYRRPMPTTNLRFLSAVMWDGRETVPGQSIRDNLLRQALNAVLSHAQGMAPTAAQLRAIVDFELGLVTAQSADRVAGSLMDTGVRGGPHALARQPFCIGINDPLRMLPAMPGACLAGSTGLDSSVFSLFGSWSTASSLRRQAIARGEVLFNTRKFVIDSVPGLNGRPGDPVSGPIANGTCTLCHDSPNAGNHSVAMALNLGVADASRRTADMPLFTLRNTTTGAMTQTTDPGRAMVTGKWNDIGKFKGPVLRALAARPPYFHDGSAATLGDVLSAYDKRFHVEFTEQEKADLIAFLGAL